MHPDLLQDTIAGGSPPGGIRGGARGCAVRRGTKVGVAPRLEHGFITRARVVGPITRDLGDRIGNLFQQSGQRLAVVHPTPGELHRDDLFRALINPQVQLAPRAPAAHPMFLYTPFPRAVDFQPGRINDDMAWAPPRSKAIVTGSTPWRRLTVL